jgi:hypothetical protein
VITPAQIIETLEERSVKNLEVVVGELRDLRQNVVGKERERDLLLRESAPVLRRDRAAECAELSVSRVEQIIGGSS